MTWQTQPYLRPAQGDPARIPIEEAQQPQSLPARPSGCCQHVCGLQGASNVGLTGAAQDFLSKRPLDVDHESIPDASHWLREFLEAQEIRVGICAPQLGIITRVLF